MTEQWKKIEEYPQYSISNLGRVRHDEKNKILVPFAIGKKGNQYQAVDLYPKKSVRIHRLVAKYFIPNPENKPEVNHIDGDKTNNQATNLEWVSGSENCVHAYRVLGRKKFFGADNATSKKVIRVEDGKLYGSLQEAAKDCGLASHTSISNALSGQKRTAGGYHWKNADDQF